MGIQSERRPRGWVNRHVKEVNTRADRLSQRGDGDATALGDLKAPSPLPDRAAAQSSDARHPEAPGARRVAAMEIGLAVGEIALEFDSVHGGFGGAPKYPHTQRHALLLSYYRWTGDQGAIKMVLKSLDAMIAGALYDHIGGGFFRYCTDDGWTQPYCEKSLADNALLAKLYLRAYESTGARRYARVARHTLDYVLRALSSPEGGLYSSEGRGAPEALSAYYGWTRDELRDLLRTAELEPLCRYYGVADAPPRAAEANPTGTDPRGHMDARARPAVFLLRVTQPLGHVAERLGQSEMAVLTAIRRGRRRLKAARARRQAPGRDHTIRTALNALMVSALADAYRILGEGGYLRTANRITDFILTQLRDDDGGLVRASRDGSRDAIPELEDCALVCDALLDLHEVSAGADPKHLRAATELALRMCQDFGAVGGGFHNAHRKSTEDTAQRRGLAARDGQVPCGNAVAARVMARLADYHDRTDYADTALRALVAVGEHVARSPRSCCSMLSVAVDLCERGLYRGAVL